MQTFTGLKNLFTNLSNNTSTANDTLAGTLINIQHKYLLQKYFDNERTYNTLTIGSQSLTLTGSLSSGATSATLSSAWTSQSVQQLVTFSNSDQRLVTFTQNSTAIFWQAGLSASATTAITTIGVQFYPIPANVSKIKNSTITVGQLVYTPAPIQTIQEWTQLNALPYTSNIPNYYFIYNNQVGFFPIPSSSNQLITFTYKARVPDMTFADVTAGTVALTAGSNSVTGTSTSWNTTALFPLNVDLSFFNLMLIPTPPKGDGYPYPIERFTSDTALLLNLPIVAAPAASGVSYTIGQVPLLQEDFHDMLVYGALKVYFSSIRKDESEFKLYDGLYSERLALMEAYLGTKSVNVDLGAQPTPNNPNLYLFASS